MVVHNIYVIMVVTVLLLMRVFTVLQVVPCGALTKFVHYHPFQWNHFNPVCVCVCITCVCA